MSCILVNCLPNSHKSTPNFNAQFRTLKKFSLDKDAFIKKKLKLTHCAECLLQDQILQIYCFSRKKI